MALLGGSSSALGVALDPQTVCSWPSHNLHLSYWGGLVSCQHPTHTFSFPQLPNQCPSHPPYRTSLHSWLPHKSPGPGSWDTGQRRHTSSRGSPDLTFYLSKPYWEGVYMSDKLCRLPTGHTASHTSHMLERQEGD